MKNDPTPPAPVNRLVGQLIAAGKLDHDRDHLGTYIVMADGRLPHDGMTVTFDKDILKSDGLEHAWRPGEWTVTLRPICKMLVPIYGKWGECQGGFKYMRHVLPNATDQRAGASPAPPESRC